MLDFRFNWAPEFEINIEELDVHHRQFFEIGRDCEQLIQMKCIGVTDQQLLNIVSKLKEYITYHFYLEEAMMRDYAYPKTDEHVESHDQFAKKVSDIKLPELRANPLEVIKDIYSLLQNAVLFHILVDDKDMAAYILKIQEKMKKETEAMGTKVDVFEEKYGVKICDMEVSTAYLLNNQQSRGRSILIFKDKAKDITQISALERSIYMDDLTRFTRGIRAVFSPDAFNYAAYCDVEERLHTYVIPKYIDAKQYGEPFTLDGQEIRLSEEKYREMAEKIRKAIK
jgi:hemerythrin-like metal-binding protein